MNQKVLIGVLIVIVAIIALLVISDITKNSKINIKTEVDSIQPTNTQSDAKVKIEDLIIGEGNEVKSGDSVVMHYKGTLKDGTQFDSSYDRGDPFTTRIGVGEVIQGWDQGIPGMKIGGKRKLTIPPELGYGATDMGNIPPNSTLIFEVELLEIK